MSLAVSPWTGNSHEDSRQFVNDHLDLLMGGFAKDTCENGMRQLCLNAFGRYGVGSHHLGGMGRKSVKGRPLVGSDDNTDDANEKSTGCSCWVKRRYCLAGITKLGERVAGITKLE